MVLSCVEGREVYYIGARRPLATIRSFLFDHSTLAGSRNLGDNPFMLVAVRRQYPIDSYTTTER